MPLTLERRYRFSAAHRYFRPEWSEEENFRRFGKCALAPGHGHNYRLTIEVRGDVDPLTGFVVDLSSLDHWIQSRIIEPLDHRHLNEAIPEFADGELVPSSENLVRWIRGQLRDGLPIGVTLASIRVAEDDDLAACWREGGDVA